MGIRIFWFIVVFVEILCVGRYVGWFDWGVWNIGDSKNIWIFYMVVVCYSIDVVS